MYYPIVGHCIHRVRALGYRNSIKAMMLVGKFFLLLGRLSLLHTSSKVNNWGSLLPFPYMVAIPISVAKAYSSLAASTYKSLLQSQKLTLALFWGMLCIIIWIHKLIYAANACLLACSENSSYIDLTLASKNLVAFMVVKRVRLSKDSRMHR